MDCQTLARRDHAPLRQGLLVTFYHGGLAAWGNQSNQVRSNDSELENVAVRIQEPVETGYPYCNPIWKLNG